jgi:exodeoxyribonuclease VII large subunit
MNTQIQQTNAQEYTVSELSGALKRVVEDRFSFVKVRGEISGYRGPHTSGHVYFSIKDQNARIDAVIWKGVFGKMRIQPEEGLEVIASGKVTTFAGKSAYQLVIESLEPAGVGALMALLEERRRRFAAEGLFAAERKKPLPYLPRVLGVVTSPTGAVIRDIIHRVAERFPLDILVWPVRVQGESSGAEVANAIRGFNALPAAANIPVPDMLIIARGGGSLEDLWSFNDEAVVRAAANSKIPLVSAVGHETDWTLIDHVADRRAPTPTAAAEIAVPVRSELLAAIADQTRRHGAAMQRALLRLRVDFRNAGRSLPTGDACLSAPRQRLDISGARLFASLREAFGQRALLSSRLAGRLALRSPQAMLARDDARLASLGARLASVKRRSVERYSDALAVLLRRQGAAYASQRALALQNLSARRSRVQSLGLRLESACRTRLQSHRAVIGSWEQMLRSLSYANVLLRGFVLLRNSGGKVLRSAAELSAGMAVDIQLADGHAQAVVTDDERRVGLSPGKPRKIARNQGSLF